MKNRIILFIICLVVSQSSIIAQDKYFPVAELTQFFELDKIVDKDHEILVPSANTWTLESQDLVRIYPTQVYTFAQVEFDIPRAGDAIIGVYDLNDKKVKSIAFNYFETGTYKKTIQTKNLKKGTYYVKLQMEGYTETKRLTIVK